MNAATRVSTGPLLPLGRTLTWLILAGWIAGGCGDVRQALELREEIRARHGWREVTLRVDATRSYVEVELTDPALEHNAPTRGTAAAVARIARRLHEEASEVDSIGVTFLTTEERGEVLGDRDVERRYVFRADAL